jgi:hypothetical protein
MTHLDKETVLQARNILRGVGKGKVAGVIGRYVARSRLLITYRRLVALVSSAYWSPPNSFALSSSGQLLRWGQLFSRLATLSRLIPSLFFRAGNVSGKST